jgi:transcriptional regulator with XRE-family HTH domain
MPPRISTIGQRIYELRTSRAPKLTQHHLAERARVSVDVIQKLEQGRKTSARITTLTSIAHALGTDLAAILTEDSEEVGATNRRQLLSTAAGLAGAAVVGAPGHGAHEDPTCCS